MSVSHQPIAVDIRNRVFLLRSECQPSEVGGETSVMPSAIRVWEFIPEIFPVVLAGEHAGRLPIMPSHLHIPRASLFSRGHGLGSGSVRMTSVMMARAICTASRATFS